MARRCRSTEIAEDSSVSVRVEHAHEPSGGRSQIDADEKVHRRALHRLRPTASPSTAGVGRSKAAAMAAATSPRGRRRIRVSE
jgi:hypothetical protein